MPAKDETRWTQNEDGSWSRIVSDEYLVDEDGEISAEVSATSGALAAAETLGVDIATVSGTGKDGKVTKADVEAAAG